MTSKSYKWPERVMVCGSRTWKDYAWVSRVLGGLPASVVLMHGGAGGADEIAHDVAQDYEITVEVFSPDRGRPSPQRYHERNDEMLSKADHVIAFWDGKSRGTRSVIKKAAQRGLPHEIHTAVTNLDKGPE